MLRDKILLTDQIRKFMRDERHLTGKSAELVSEEIGKSKGWLAHLENGRTKSISRDDFIKLISYLREDSDLQKIEAFIHTTLVAINRNLELPSSPDDENVQQFIDTNDYSPAGLRKSFQEWLNLIAETCTRIFIKYPDQKTYVDTLYNIFYNLNVAPGISLSIMGSPINRLGHLNKTQQQEFYNKYMALIDEYGQDDDLDIALLNNFSKTE